MSNRQELTGTLEKFTPKGAILSGQLVIWSKWMEGDPLQESHIGSVIKMLVDPIEDRFYVRRILSIGSEAATTGPSPDSASPSAPSGSRSKGAPTGGGAGGFRRFSPEEIALKKADGERIARCVAVERAIDLLRHGISIERIGVTAKEIEHYLLTGVVPQGNPSQEDAPSSSTPEAPASQASEPPKARTSKAPKGSKASKPAKERSRKSSARLASAKVEPRKVNELFNMALDAKVVADLEDFQKICRHVLGDTFSSIYSLKSGEFDQAGMFIQSLIDAQKPRLAS